MTQEERADNFSAKWLRQDQVQISYDGYMQGATDQQKICAEKVRECLKGILAENMISAVCKAMED